MNAFSHILKVKKVIPWRRIALETIVFLCVLLFAYTALSKLIAMGKFLGQIRSAPIIGPYSNVVIWAVPVAELMVAAMVTWPRLRLAGLTAFITMMSIFTIYIIYIIGYAPHIPCSCGGVLEAMGWGDHLIFNILFIGIGMAALVMVMQRTQRSKHEPPLRWHDIKNFFRKKQGKAENL